MKKNEELQKDVQDTFYGKTILNEPENGMITKVLKHSKKLVYLAIFAGTGMFFNSCAAGFVATEPTYQESVRPDRPSDVHIWIDGEWVWSNRTKTYNHNDGYWTKPNHSRVFIAGHWQTSSRGSHWVPGHWQGHSHMMNHVN